MQRTHSERDISPLSRTSLSTVGPSAHPSDRRSRTTYHRAHDAGSSRFSHPRPAPIPSTSPASPVSPLVAKSVFAHLDYFGPAGPSGSSLVKRSNTIGTPPAAYHRTMPHVADIDLTSPRVSGSSKITHPQRRSVQFEERSNVNWARPLRSDMSIPEEPPASSFQLLGTSMQRNRRLARSPLPHTPSPCSSMDESPMTPTTPDSAPASRSWTLPSVSHAKGLGFGPEVDWTDMDSDSESALADYLESSSPTPSRGTPTPRHSRILSTFESLAELSNPTTLEELQHLRQAALDLQAQASPSRYSAPTEATRARRIKRKAVPAFDLRDVDARPVSTPEFTTIATFPKPMRVLSTELPTTSPSLPMLPTTSGTCTPRNKFYGNIIGATRSVVEISPRTSSLPYMSSHRRMTSEQSSSSSSASDADEPITPSATAERDAFARQVEEGLRALNVSAIELDGFTDDGIKRKRGFSRFFRKTPTDL